MPGARTVVATICVVVASGCGAGTTFSAELPLTSPAPCSPRFARGRGYDFMTLAQS
jgi:hypothetical protein